MTFVLFPPLSLSYTINGDTLFAKKYVDEDTSVLQIYSINQLTNNQPENCCHRKSLLQKNTGLALINLAEIF